MLRCQVRRLDLKKTQYDIERETGIRQSDVSAIERGRVNPTPEELQALSLALGLPVEKLLEEVIFVEQTK